MSWLPDRNGVRCDVFGEIYSPSFWGRWESGPPQGFSLELWLQSDTDTYSPILLLGDLPRHDNFAIAESLSDLLVEGRFWDGTHERRTKLWLDGAFPQGQPRFLTITSDAQGTALYLEGARARFYPKLMLATDHLSGRLLLGHAPDGQQVWTGEIFGVAFYPRALTAGEVSGHYQDWRESKFEALKQDGAAVYPFDEGQGQWVRDRAQRMPALWIPPHFRRLHRTPLEVPVKLTFSDLRDALINVLGFAPFGFLLVAYFQSTGNSTSGKAVLGAIAVGVLTSLAIEVIQVYLPGRDSSLLDLINNSLGTVLGAVAALPLLQSKTVQLFIHPK